MGPPGGGRARAFHERLGYHGMLMDTVVSSRRSPASSLAGLLRCMRPQQWVKNGFVFAPALFAGRLFEAPTALASAAAFAAFSAAASAVYLLNDIVDVEADRAHPKKRLRPIASGALPVPLAYVALVLLLLIGVGGAWFVAPPLALILLAYFGLNVLYSLKLKHQVILDVIIIAAGFVLRVEAGAAAIAVQPSTWLLVCTSMLALFLGFSKRRHELTLPSTETRRVLEEYSEPFLDQMMGLVTALTVISYLMYCVAPETEARFGRGMLLTFPFVLYGVFRYQYLVYHRNEAANPTDTLLTDRPLLATAALWAMAAAAVIAGIGS